MYHNDILTKTASQGVAKIPSLKIWHCHKYVAQCSLLKDTDLNSDYTMPVVS